MNAPATLETKTPRLFTLIVLAAVLVAALALTLKLGRSLVLAQSKPKPPKVTAGVATGGDPVKKTGWDEVDRLVDEQKYEAAAAEIEKLREAAKARRDNPEWTKALVREVLLRMGLHGYETAVRFLKEQPWPQDELSQDILNLFYAQSLMNYYEAYSWEINKREKVASQNAVDLKAWTRDDLSAEAARAYESVWAHRAKLGDHAAKSLPQYLIPNTYPEGIRPTLRDAVSYLYCEFLANSAYWTPRQSNDLFTLDRDALLKENPKWWEKEEKPENTHPLYKVCAILGDLESWHALRGDREAAFEARLERLRRLHDHLTGDEDRALLRKDLADRLSSYRPLPWYSMGVAQLAEFTEAESAPDALVRARGLALEGKKAYPDSPGGQRCASIVARIEMPSFSLEAMATDAPSKRSVRVRHRNLAQLHLKAIPFDLVARIASARDYNLLPQWAEVRTLLTQGKPAAEWSMALPATSDYRDHATFNTPPALPPGAYLLAGSADTSFQPQGNRVEAEVMIVSDLVMMRRDDGDGGHEVTVLSGAAGTPVRGAEVTLYSYDWQKGHHPEEKKATGEDGTVRFTRKDQNRSYFLFAKLGDQIALEQAYLGFYRPQPPQETTASLIYTDRSIYRPGQKLYWKVLSYKGRPDLGRLQAAAQQAVNIILYDLNNQKVADANVSTNAYGTASGEFLIPPGRPLGGWRLLSSPYGQTQLRVEEYKRPSFEASFKEPESPLRLNRPALLKGEAKYYFGLPVVNGSAAWTVKRTPVYPWWWGYWWGHDTGNREQLVAAGNSPLKEDGSFEVAFTPSADERDAAKPGISYRYKITADVTDEGGETRTATRSVRLGFVAVEARVSSEMGFFQEEVSGKLQVARTDLDGTPRAGKGTWRLLALRQPEKALLPADQPLPQSPAAKGAEPFKTDGDKLRPRWETQYSSSAILMLWADGEERGKGTAEHNAKGVADIALPRLKSGAYRLRYETSDDFGAKCEAQFEFVVAEAKPAVLLPYLFLTEQSTVQVGGTARFLVHSALPGQTLYLQRFVAGKLVERRTLIAGKDPAIVAFPVGEEQRGGFAVSLTALRDHQVMNEIQQVFVPWDNKELQVEFASFRDKLRPGNTETWRIAVKSPSGKPAEAGAAEVLAYMYDKSLDLFAPHTPPSPLSLYPNRSGYSAWSANLGQAPGVYSDENNWYHIPGYPDFRGDLLDFFDSYGIGGPGARYARTRYGVMGYSTGGVAGGVMEDRAMAMPMAAPPAPMKMMAKTSLAASAEGKAKDEADAPREAGEAESGAKANVTAPEGGEVQLRSNFAETAFWQPHLLTGPDGTALIEFTVPDSVTAWNVWVHAVTRDLQSASLHKETRSVKELMVRPYVPRFFREGDRAEMKVVVNNASERELKGQVTMEIFDPETKENLAPAFGLPEVVPPQPFTVKAGGGSDLSFSLTAPARVGTVAFQVVAKCEGMSDGELRPLPILPGRMHLAQSRFVTLRENERRDLTFADLAKNDDPSRINEQLVVTVDGQLFYGLLEALPYLVNYPYECTEQTLNRFLSTGILSSLYGDYPAVGKMAQEFSKRETRLETWDQADPNRKMALEETPWLEEAKGGAPSDLPLAKVLDPRVAAAQRDASLAKLLKAQTSLGAWPWWAGGPPSPYMTLYIVYGFSKAAEFGVEIPKEPVVNAFSYLHRHYLDECVKEMMANDVGWEHVTFLNYVLSNFPDESWTGGVFTAAERKQMLDFSFKHWKDHSPYLKGFLTLTLKRMNRPGDAKLVWDSVMDSAKTTRDEGTSWAPEDRGWLWYNDTVETHAFALRTLMELDKKDTRSEGLVQWIYLNKKLNHWESTRGTAEVLYSVAHYLKATGALGARETVTVNAGPVRTEFVFEPSVYTGKKNQVVIPGEKVDGKTMSTIGVEKAGKGLAFASVTWHFSTEKLPEQGDGNLFGVTRTYFRRFTQGEETRLEPLAEGAPLKVGDEIEVHLSLRSRHPAEYVHLRDPRPSGCEPVTIASGYKWDLGLVRYEEVRDSGQNFFMEWMPQGEYTLKYRLRCSMAGVFKVNPATLQSMYAPEFNAYSAANTVTIKSAK